MPLSGVFQEPVQVERVTESEILAPSASAFNEHEIRVSTEVAEEGRSNYLPIPILKCELVEQSTSLSRDSNEDQIVFRCELIAQSTLLSRGDSGGGSVCDNERHGSGVGNDCRDGGDDSGGQGRRISSDRDSNGGSGGLKDSDGFNDNCSFAGICNSESVSGYNGGAWHYVNAVKGAASGGSNSGGVGDIDSGSEVVADSNGVEAGGSDETRNAEGEAVVEGIVVGGSNEADDGDALELYYVGLLSRGNSRDGSVCEDDRHSSGVGNDCMVGGDDSSGQSKKTSSDYNSNGGSGGLKDSDGSNYDRSFAGMCNGERVSGYDGGAWDCVKAVRSAAREGSNSGGAGDIDSGGGIVTDLNGQDGLSGEDGFVRSDDCRNLFRVEQVTELEILAPSVRALNETEILVSTKASEGGRKNYLPIHVSWDMWQTNCDVCDNANDDKACNDEDTSDACDDTVQGFDSDGCGGASRDSVDGRSGVDYSSEPTKNHAVEGADLIFQLKLWEITRLRIRICRMTCYAKQLKKVNYGIVVGLKAAKCELKRLRKTECDLQRKELTTVVKINLQRVRDLVTEKIGIEVSRQADGQRLAVEKVDLKNILQLGSVNRLASGSTVTGDMRKKQRVGQREEQPEISI
eukprot:CAMPEP_0179427372 /NCGR_PEP_ID=MMETSP0799-20121207/13342_1 /TAXON_ID=46947 /ORGANISM="Geminigera cryophila, Strain CCMP2564" /LENGTH=630 /DNA_ID=CAMNT_0021202397 /DNA_START=535 /DNA_END=2429 /DNA_ORIENTATION=+